MRRNEKKKEIKDEKRKVYGDIFGGLSTSLLNVHTAAWTEAKEINRKAESQ